MSSIGEEVKTFMDDYNAAAPGIRSAKREYALFELFKWENVRDEIRKFGKEETTGMPAIGKEIEEEEKEMTFYRISEEVARNVIAKLNWIIEDPAPSESDIRKSVSHTLHEFETGLYMFEEETFRSLVTRAIGQASMCWEFPKKAGIFDTEAAVKIVDELLDCKCEEKEGVKK